MLPATIMKRHDEELIRSRASVDKRLKGFAFIGRWCINTGRRRSKNAEGSWRGNGIVAAVKRLQPLGPRRNRGRREGLMTDHEEMGYSCGAPSVVVSKYVVRGRGVGVTESVRTLQSAAE